MFESLLLERISAFQAEHPVYVEGESKKIGQLQVPDALMERMRASPCIVLDTAVEVRVDLLLDEYRHFLANRSALDKQLDCLTALHGRERITEWKYTRDWRELVRRLLVEHYDPAYRRSSSRNFARLTEARAVRIAAAAEAEFARAADILLDREPVSA
jgi:tRNA 2-selenouridine synthase